MVIAIGVLLSLVCIGVAAVPFLKYRRSRQTVDPTEVIAQLEGQRQLIYREVLTLEESSRAGAVPDPEFNAVTETLLQRAAETLWLQHRWEERLADLDGAIEGVISELKGGETMFGGLEEGEASHSCSECGAMGPLKASNCSMCGAEFERGTPVSGPGESS